MWLYIEIYYKELAYVTVEAYDSKACSVSQQAQPRESR